MRIMSLSSWWLLRWKGTTIMEGRKSKSSWPLWHASSSATRKTVVDSKSTSFDQSMICVCLTAVNYYCCFRNHGMSLFNGVWRSSLSTCKCIERKWKQFTHYNWRIWQWARLLPWWKTPVKPIQPSTQRVGVACHKNRNWSSGFCSSSSSPTFGSSISSDQAALVFINRYFEILTFSNKHHKLSHCIITLHDDSILEIALTWKEKTIFHE